MIKGKAEYTIRCVELAMIDAKREKGRVTCYVGLT